MSKSPKRSALAKAFLSPEEPRLRAGWRLLVHATMVLLLMMVFTPVVLTLLAVAGVSLDPMDFTTAIQVSVWASLPAVLVATWIARRWIDHRSMLSLGLQRDRYLLPDLTVGILLPALLLGLFSAILWAGGWIEVQGWAFDQRGLAVAVPALAAFAQYVAVGVQEEVLSRGYHLRNLIEGTNLPLGVFLSSLLFALLHGANPEISLLGLLGIFASGLLFAFAWMRTGRLWLAIGLHTGWNFFEGTFFGFPVSGTKGFTLIHHRLNGPSLLTGGAFGPEGSLLIFPLLGLGALLLWSYTRDRDPEVQASAETEPS
jgi:membrane protease YdiL (CAAX protease family)